MTGNDDKKQSFEDYQQMRGLRIDEILESWRTAADFSLLALKSAILLNGAAVGGLLTFIATLWDAKENTAYVPKLAAAALNDFVIGAFVAVIATGLAYLTAYTENRCLWAWVKRRDNWAKAWNVSTKIFHCLALAAIIYSYWKFWTGGSSALEMLGL